MATYNSTNIQNKTGVAAGNVAGMVHCAYAEVVCSSAPSTSDTLNFFYLPANARIVGATLEATDMDTNVSPTLTLNIGDSGSATRLFSASTVGQAGTAAAATAVAGLHYKTTAKTLITGVAQANAATGAAGSVYLSVLYIVE
jgi:hypothetical protein